jgi:hypothetical protein
MIAKLATAPVRMAMERVNNHYQVIQLSLLG